MNYRLYKLVFSGGAHFGTGLLGGTDISFCADTLFSALSIEALNIDEKFFNKFIECSISGKLLFSDALPYVGNELYLPKPVIYIDSGSETGDSTIKKAYKNMKYVPLSQFDNYMTGRMQVDRTGDLKALGCSYIRVSAAVRTGTDAQPFSVGTFFFNKGCGLYITVGGADDDILDGTENLLNNLGFSGIGGKRSGGLGRFTVESMDVPAELKNKFTAKGEKYMTLSVSLPNKNEMSSAMEGATYQTIKRSGFVYSENYADKFMRKKDLFMLSSGSVFNRRFNGDIYDVGLNGRHPVYRYGKPIMISVL